MYLSLGAIGIADDLGPALDAIPVKQSGSLLDLVGEKFERIRRYGTVGRLLGNCSRYVCAATERVLWVFQELTCQISSFS
jgi:hypothetical protein